MSQAAARMLNTDLQGSVTSVTDFGGNPIAINRYDEYGRPQAGNTGRFQYTGQAWLPEIGLYYYKARMYSPTLGRFMQTDPIGYADGVNWYNYVGADPVNFVDPTGLETTINADGSTCVTTYHYHYSVYRNGRGIVVGPFHSDGSTTTCVGGDDGIVVRAAPRGGGPRGGPRCPPSQGINDRVYPIPPGFNSIGMQGNRFVRDGNGVIQPNPNYTSARGKAKGVNWWGVMADLTLIAVASVTGGIGGKTVTAGQAATGAVGAGAAAGSEIAHSPPC